MVVTDPAAPPLTVPKGFSDEQANAAGVAQFEGVQLWGEACAKLVSATTPKLDVEETTKAAVVMFQKMELQR